MFNESLLKKYNKTALVYDLLDFPCEYFYYRKWRPEILKDISGNVLEAGVGTGRNLPYYNPDVNLVGVDLSPAMLSKANKRSRLAKCQVTLLQQDCCDMHDIPSSSFDWLVSSFLCCVMPNELQPLAIKEFARILKPSAKFKLIEIIYSQNAKIRARQQKLAPYVEKIFGARFDRNTIQILSQQKNLIITRTSFLKDDTYVLIEGIKTV